MGANQDYSQFGSGNEGLPRSMKIDLHSGNGLIC
jgi:hypothetical protein